MMSRKSLLHRALIAFGIVLVAASSSRAATMADLLSGGSITCGDKTFLNFRTFVSNAAGGADAPTSAQIFVTPDTANCGTFNPGPGLVFQSANWNVNAGGTMDTAFTYDVIAPGLLMHDALLSFLSYDAQNGGEIHITESLIDSLNTSVQNLSVDSLTGPTADSHIFSGLYSFLTVNMDVSLEGHANGNASLSTFTVNISEIPEPTSVVMVGLGLAGVIVGARRRRSRPS